MVCRKWRNGDGHGAKCRSTKAIVEKFENTVKVLNSNDEHISYYSKDHEKLQTILRDRQLPIDGTRDEMIQRLKDHPANYGLRTSSELTNMLKRRRVPGNIHGKKAVKIAKLMLNDDIWKRCGRGSL
jgi:hypothetical protein